MCRKRHLRCVSQTVSMQRLLWLRFVAAGGAIGAGARWALLELIPTEERWVILGINVVGSTLFGVLTGLRYPRRGRPRLTANQYLLLATAGFIVVCILAAGKIFRIGMLSQGQTPSYRKLVGWLLSK